MPDKVVVSNEDCFTIRYGVKPENLGQASYNLGHDGDSYTLQSKDQDMRGQGAEAKDVEAVLCWDDAKQHYILRMVSHNLRVSKVVKHRPTSAKNSFLRTTRVSTPQAVQTPPQLPQSDVPTPADDSDDDFSNFASELAGELGNKSAQSVQGTAGLSLSDEEVESEEE